MAGWGCRGGPGMTRWPGVPPRCRPAGFLTPGERRRLEGLRSPYNKFWVPLAWFGALAGQARREGRLSDDCALKLLMEVPPDPPKTPHSLPEPPRAPQAPTPPAPPRS